MDPRETMELFRGRSETLSFPAAVTTLGLTVYGVPTTKVKKRPAKFDPQSLTRKEKEQEWAAFGENAVARRREREGHLPEARFTWEPLGRRVHAAKAGGL